MSTFAEDGMKQCLTDRAMVVLPNPNEPALPTQSAPFALQLTSKQLKAKRTHAAALTSVHVDDNLITGTTAGIQAASASLDRVFKTTNDPAPSLVCGVQIERCRPHYWLKLHQHGYVMRLLEREGMLDSHPASTPLNKGMTKQDSYNDGLPDTAADLAARKHFRQILGCLVWLRSKCRVDLCVTVNFYGRMGPYAKQVHVDMIRGQPLRYLNGTRDFGLVYQAGGSFETNGASDADFAGCLVTNRSTIGGFGKKGEFGLIWDGCTLVKQIQTSTGHSETTACAAWCKEQKASSIQQREFGLEEERRTPCLVDNAGVVKQAINTTNHAQAKHYRVAQGYIREMCDTDEVRLVQTPTDDNPADFFTKALDRGPFQKHRHTIMGPQRNPGLPPLPVKADQSDWQPGNDDWSPSDPYPACSASSSSSSSSSASSGSADRNCVMDGRDAFHQAQVVGTDHYMEPLPTHAPRHDKPGYDCSRILKAIAVHDDQQPTTTREQELAIVAAEVEVMVKAELARRLKAKEDAELAHNIELNRQCVEQTWQQVGRRGRSSSKRHAGDQPSTGSLSKVPGPGGPPRLG